VSLADEPAGASDTIVAIATPPGVGAVGLIRVSGPDALKVVAPVVQLVSGRPAGCAEPRVLHRVRVVDPATSESIDDGLAVYMPEPRSYTGEDVVEISCHGNPVVLARVVSHLIGAGARLAEPGEFTRRAFLNGRVDLIQAEAVALLIGARTERAAQLAVRQLEGALSDNVRAVRDAMVDMMAGLEVALDFPDDEVGTSRDAAAARCAAVAERLRRLVVATERGRLLEQGVTVMLTGAPNVGKSSLLNMLLERDRAIVSPSPGTTRDVIDGETVVDGVCVRLVDGAGLGEPRDALDAEGMARTRRAIDGSDLVVVVMDGSRPRSDADEAVLRYTADRPRLIVSNKADLPTTFGGECDCRCSALTEAGVAPLRQALEVWVKEQVSTDAEEGGIVASLRVRERLAGAGAACSRARDGLAAAAPIQAVLIDLRDALVALEDARGPGVDEAILDRIFATFCVGK
jgi:tRNA modification GTPase